MDALHLLYKDEKPSVCLSVGTFWHALSFAVSPRIRAKFARNEAPVLGEHGVHFKMVLIHVVRRLQHSECQGVDDSCRNFNQNSCRQNRSPDTLIIYTTIFTPCVIAGSGCGGCISGVR